MIQPSQTEMAFRLALSRKPTTIEHTAMEELVKEQLIQLCRILMNTGVHTSMKNIPCPSTATTINRRRVLSGVSGVVQDRHALFACQPMATKRKWSISQKES